MMNSRTQEKKQRQALAISVVGVLAVFAVFLAVWLKQTALIRDAENYDTTVERHLAAGNVKRAMEIARLAGEKNPLDLAARSLYAEVLMKNGRTEDALDQYQQVFAIDATPNPNYNSNIPGQAPKTIPTQRPYFHAPARLEVGGFHYSQENLVSAVDCFELARAFGQTIPSRWHTLLHEAYSDFGVWGRAFEYHVPEGDALSSIPADGLIALARMFASQARWQECLAAAEALGSEPAHLAQSRFWSGCALLAMERNKDAAESLQIAMDGDHPDAPFLLGLALEHTGMAADAPRAFLSTSRASLYRPFAVARTIELLKGRLEELISDADQPQAEPEPESSPVEDVENVGQSAESPETEHRQIAANGEPSETDQERGQIESLLESLTDELRQFFLRQLPLPQPQTWVRNGARPTGFSIERNRHGPGVPFLFLTRWSDVGQPVDASFDEFALTIGTFPQMKLTCGNRVLDLRWVTNVVPFGDFDSLHSGASLIPGWPEVYRSPKTAPGTNTIFVETAEVGRRLVTASHEKDGMANCATVFLPAAEAHFYLLAVRCKSDGVKLVAGWRWYNGRDELVDSHNVINQEIIETWQWRTEYRERPVSAVYVQAAAGIFRDRGRALLDDVLVIPLDPPNPSTAGTG